VGAGRTPTDAALPIVTESKYPVKKDADDFTVDFQTVAAQLGKPGVVIIDVRPTDFYTGKNPTKPVPVISRRDQSPLHGGCHHEFQQGRLLQADRRLGRSIPSDNSLQRYGGHRALPYRASGQPDFFVLKRLLGYPNVRWYDAGWTEWAAVRNSRS